MKPSFITTICSAAMLFTLAKTADAATTYNLYKASISLPAFVEGSFVDGGTTFTFLTKRTLSTTAIINLARGLPTKTKVPKTIVLVFAADSSNIGLNKPTANSRLIVADFTNPATPTLVAEIIAADAVNPPTPLIFSENQISKAYLRVIVARGKVPGVGNILAGGADSLHLSGTMKRKPTPVGPEPTIAYSVSGRIGFKDDDAVNKTAVVLAGKFTSSGKKLGQVTF